MKRETNDLVAVWFLLTLLSLVANGILVYDRFKAETRLKLYETVTVTGGFYRGCKGFVEELRSTDPDVSLWGSVKIVDAVCQPVPYRSATSYGWMRLKASELTPVYGPAGLGR